ncbi:MAG: thioredoxin domain-containing protein [Candidatus Peribacteraceae bacterium]|nr:thioredoxin domain-containing protein [Candidatus Peribacteraceae bacterium]
MRSSLPVRNSCIAAFYSLMLAVAFFASVFLTPSGQAQSLPPITDLRIEDGELRWTAPANVSRYSIRFYTGETANRSSGFHGCGGDIYQYQNPNGGQYCAGDAVSVTRIPGALERLVPGHQPTKSFVITYDDAQGNRSEISNIAVLRPTVMPILPLPTIEDVRLEGGELRWTAPVGVAHYFITFYTGETADRTKHFGGCSQAQLPDSQCSGTPVSISKLAGALERWRVGNPLHSYVVQYDDTMGNRSGKSNVGVERAMITLPPITDLRIEGGELRWTAPANASRYFARFYTGETTSRTQNFFGCGSRIDCVGDTISLSKVPGSLERLRLRQPPVKSFVVTYADASGRESEVSNVAVYRDSVVRRPDLQIRSVAFSQKNNRGQKDVLTINLCNVGNTSHQMQTTSQKQGFGSITFRVTLNGFSDNIAPAGANDDVDDEQCRVFEIPNLLSGFSGFNHTNVPAGNYRLELTLLNQDSSNPHFTTTITVGSSSSSRRSSSSSSSIPSINVRADDHIRGSRTAPVVLIEYSDLECPYCARHQTAMKKIQAEFGGNVSWIYRHYPLTTMHKNALGAAVVSEAVAEHVGNDAFWKFIDGVYAKGTPTEDAVLSVLKNMGISQATAEGWLDPEPEEDRYQATVMEEMNQATQLGISGTPTTVVLNTRTGETEMVVGANSEPIRQAIIAMLGGTSGASSLSSSLTTAIPPAGYEDEVLTNIEAYRNPFPDTDIRDISGKAAAELYRRAVIGGFPDGQFKGDRPVNRAEAAKFLLLARFGSIEDMQNNGRFPDVLNGQWYTKFVMVAAHKEIIGGNPDGTFRPGNRVNTAEFLKMLSLTFTLDLNLPYEWEDVPPNAWYAPYAGIAQRYALFPDRIGEFAHLAPQSELTREEVAVAIYQYLRNR